MEISRYENIEIFNKTQSFTINKILNRIVPVRAKEDFPEIRIHNHQGQYSIHKFITVIFV